MNYLSDYVQQACP